MSEVKSVAVLGTGIIGTAMARNLASVGLDVAAWNRSPDKAEPLADDGITVEAESTDAVRGRDAVITILSDGDAVASVAGDIVGEIESDAIWIQASTVGPEATSKLAGIAKENDLTFVDAPVLGTRKPAEDGELIVLASGPEEAIEAAKPVFEAIGSKTVNLGEVGASSRMKLVLNNWLLTMTAGLAETITLAQTLDLDPAQFLEIIAGGPIDSGYAQMKGKSMIGKDFATSFPLRLAAKDSRLVDEAASNADLELEIARAVLSRFEAANARGLGELDMSAVYGAISDRDDDRPAAQA